MIKIFSLYIKSHKLCTCIKKRASGLKSIRLLSYKHYGGNHALMYKTVGQLLDESAEKFGDKTAFVSVYQNKKITFKEAKNQTDAFAAGIYEFGLEKGDRVGIWAGNSIEWYIASFALAKAGVISVYLNPLYQARELQHCLNAVGVKMLITTDSFRKQSYQPILDEVVPELSTSELGNLKSQNVPSLKSVVCIGDSVLPGTIPFESVLEKRSESCKTKLEKMQKIIDPDDASNIQFTSGTTGAPKGAILSHFNVVNNSFCVSERLELHLKPHKMCFMGPFFHAMGSVIGALSCLHTGVTLVSPDVAFSSSKASDAILSEQCTVLLGTPTMYVDILKVFNEKGIKPESTEIAVTGGAYASSVLFNDIKEHLGVKRVASVYGLTETGPVTFMSMVDDDKEKVTTTVGHLMNHMEAKVVDSNGVIVPWDTPGELWIRGYNNMKGYWKNEEKTRDTLTPENWLKTGDQFTLSKDGYGKIVGRIKDMIIRGGENIFPADVEEFLSNHSDILDVQVVGVPDKRLGEQVCACIRLKPNAKLTEENVKEFCKGKIAPFKIPYYVYFMDMFPKTPTGKVQKYVLRAQAMEHFKLTEER